MSGKVTRGTLIAAASAMVLTLGLASQAFAATARDYRATFVEPYGGPNHSPFECDAGASCGSGTVSGLGHVASLSIVFNDCGFGCHNRALLFADGDILYMREIQSAPFGSPGASGTHGYIGFGLPGNPQIVEIQTIVVGGTGRFEGASGGGTATVKVAGGVAIITGSGSITLP